MKVFSRLLPLLVLCAGCAKTKIANYDVYEYTVNCNFPTVYSNSESWLVVTDDAGTVLKTFDLPRGATQFMEKFEYTAAEEADTYNLHLVSRGEHDQGRINSHYGVPDGAPVVFLPILFYAPSYSANLHHLFIQGIEAVDSVNVGQYNYGAGYLPYDPSTQTVEITISTLNQAEDLMIRVRDKPGFPFRALYLPNADLYPDSTVLQWTDFLPENFATIQQPGNGQLNKVEISAVAPDFKRFTYLATYLSFDSVLVPDQVPFPANLPPESHFRVRMRQGNYFMEKIFPPGDVLRLEPTTLSIGSVLFSPWHSLQVPVGGNPDLIEVTIFDNIPGSSNIFNWIIQGPPASFSQMLLPDLAYLLPNLPDPALSDLRWHAAVYDYEHLDLAQLQAGFPYKDREGRFFELARYGMKMVTKDY